MIVRMPTRAKKIISIGRSPPAEDPPEDPAVSQFSLQPDPWQLQYCSSVPPWLSKVWHLNLPCVSVKCSFFQCRNNLQIDVLRTIFPGSPIFAGRHSATPFHRHHIPFRRSRCNFFFIFCVFGNIVYFLLLK